MSYWPASGSSLLYPVTVTLDPSDPDRVFVLDSVVVLLHSDDGGATWVQGGQRDIESTDAFDVAVDPFDSKRVLIAARYAQVCESLDSGSSFHELASLPVGSIGHLVFDRHRSGVLLAFMSYGVWRSTDGGASWNQVLAPDSVDINIAAAVGTEGDLIGGGPFGIFRSSDGGAAWSRVADGPSAASVSSLASDPSSTSGIWAGTWNRGVYHSSDCGESWSWMAKGPDDDVTTLAVDPLDPEIVYAGTYGSGMMKSTDGGATWTYVFELPPKDWGVLAERQIMVKESGQRRLWLVTRNDGIH